MFPFQQFRKAHCDILADDEALLSDSSWTARELMPSSRLLFLAKRDETKKASIEWLRV